MKSDEAKVEKLFQFMKSLHEQRLNELQDRAKKFHEYLKRLDGFKIETRTAGTKHVGRVVVDGVLQVGKDYEKQVRTAVERIERFPEATTVSGFIHLLNERELKELINFKTDNTKKDLLKVAEFFAHEKIETFDDLYRWFELEENRDKLLTKNSGLSGAVFRIADKTADYFRVLVGHWDAVAVDKGIRELLDKAGIISKHSLKYNYKELRTIVQLTALLFNERPIDLDDNIYNYYVANRRTEKKLKNPDLAYQEHESRKFCIECGIKISRKAKFCPECGTRQVEINRGDPTRKS